MVDSPSQDSASIRRYLLGDVSDDERERVEERLLLDDDFHDLVLVEEDDLVDAYLDGGLSPEDARRFTSVFVVAPERRAKLRFARTLRSFVEVSSVVPSEPETAPAAPPGSTKRWAISAVAAAVLVTVGLGFAVWRTRQLEQELAAARGAREADLARLREAEQRAEDADREMERLAESLRAEQEERERLATQLANRSAQGQTPPPSTAGSTVVAMTLEPGRVRGGGASASITVRRGTKTLRLRLVGAPDAPGSLDVSVRDPDGTVVWSGRASRTANALVLYVPADSLVPNDYQVVIGSGEPLERYYFRLTRR